MILRRPPLMRIALKLVTVAPVLAWAVVKPVRVLAPEWAGAACVDTTVCTGTLRLLLKPTWWVEGMAYGQSEDPRSPLAQPWEG